MALKLGTQIFAVLNIISTVVISLLLIYTLVEGVLSLALGPQYSLFTDEITRRIDLNNIFYYGLGILFLIMLSNASVIYASFLVNGVFKGKPEHIKLYFVYGIVVTVLSAISNLIYLVNTYDFMNTGIVFCVLVIYSLVLVMIYKTYKKMEVTNAPFEHRLLPEKS